MKKFNNCTGLTAQVQFCTELLLKITDNENYDGTLKKACEGELFDNATLHEIERNAKRLFKLPVSHKRNQEILKYKDKLATYCLG